MKNHTTYGYNMCNDDSELRPYAATALNHHEALNGTGYPNNLTKKDIPLEAQIVRVADIFDALVSKRQYKSHIDISDALKMIIEDARPIDRKSKILSENTSKSKYETSMNSSTKQKKKDYYLSGINSLLKNGETIENYKTLYDEYKNAYILRKNIIDNLYKEIKIIKKLKI